MDSGMDGSLVTEGTIDGVTGVGARVLMTFGDLHVELLRTRAPRKDKWSKGTGADYDVSVIGVGKIGTAGSARLDSPPMRGSRLRSGAMYTAWSATPWPAMGKDGIYRRTYYHETRKAAVEELVRVYRERS